MKSPATSAPAAPPAAPPVAAKSESPQGPQAKACSARIRASVHLRPVEQDKSAGPEIPAATELFVLARGSLSRKGLPIYRVEVKSSRLGGFVFLSDRELGPECPLVWPEPAHQKKNEPQDTALNDDLEQCFRSGTFKDRKKLFEPVCVERHGQPAAAKYQLDVDGDGRIDELHDYANELVLALNTPRGFTALLLSRGMDTEHHDGAADWMQPIRAGDSTYLVSSYHETSTFDDMEPEYVSAFSLYRVRPDGKVFDVFSYSVDQADVTREFRGNPDGTVVISDGKGRTQTLRWDEKLYRFVP